MGTSTRLALEDYLRLQYPFHVLADEASGYVITFPDLPGCMTQVETLDEVGPAAESCRRLWLQTAFEEGLDVPLPSLPESYSGRFNVRISRTLHRQLAEAAVRQGISLNQYVATLLARGYALDRGMSLPPIPIPTFTPGLTPSASESANRRRANPRKRRAPIQAKTH
jgi:predicted RNase H-like HicB family nuclease